MDRPYLFYELTNSVCTTCLRKVEAKIIIQDQKVFMQKHCFEHGSEKVLIATDVDYYRSGKNFLKPGQMPRVFNTPVKYGCPYDCGICTDHEQHGCLTLIEITDQCNLTCPICYAESSPAQKHRSLELVKKMIDAAVRNEGEPDVVQISGGEPTIHPQFFEILDYCKTQPIKHLMVNTNGIRIAQDFEFAKRLKDYLPGFELYLQFDSLRAEVHRDLRGADLTAIRQKALEHLNELGISTNLVVTLKKGLNDDEIGSMIDFALKQSCVRGVTFQPIQGAGRTENFDAARDRLTLTEVRQKILEQHSLFQAQDIIPVPCHPDCLAMAYALKIGGEAIPLTRWIDPQTLVNEGGNTIIYEGDPRIKKQIFELFSTAHSPDSSALSLKQLLCCLPQIEAPQTIGYDKVFRIIIMQFLDAQSLDVRSVKRSCIHIVHPDGRLIPFDTYNIFYRGDKEARLKMLQEETLARSAIF